MEQVAYYQVELLLFCQKNYKNMFNLSIDSDSKEFWNGAKKGKLMIQKCLKSNNFFLYSRAHIKSVAEDNFTWVEASGKGVIYSYTISYIPHIMFHTMCHIMLILLFILFPILYPTVYLILCRRLYPVFYLILYPIVYPYYTPYYILYYILYYCICRET